MGVAEGLQASGLGYLVIELKLALLLRLALLLKQMRDRLGPAIIN